MKKLLSVSLIIGMTLIIQVNSYSQKQDSLIQLYPGIGDTLYYFDKEYFELFQTVKGFKYAVFYIRDNKELVSLVTFKSEGILKDTVTTYGLSLLENVRLNIKKTIEGNNNRLN